MDINSQCSNELHQLTKASRGALTKVISGILVPRGGSKPTFSLLGFKSESVAFDVGTAHYVIQRDNKMTRREFIAMNMLAPFQQLKSESRKLLNAVNAKRRILECDSDDDDSRANKGTSKQQSKSFRVSEVVSNAIVLPNVQINGDDISLDSIKRQYGVNPELLAANHEAFRDEKRSTNPVSVYGPSTNNDNKLHSVKSTSALNNDKSSLKMAEGAETSHRTKMPNDSSVILGEKDHKIEHISTEIESLIFPSHVSSFNCNIVLPNSITFQKPVYVHWLVYITLCYLVQLVASLIC